MHRNLTSLTRSLSCAWLAGAMLTAASAQAAPAAEEAPSFDRAMTDYERNHWDQAYAAFTALADQGHAEAARIALQMWRHGPALYQRSFAANAHQVARWSRVWRCGGADASARACQLALQQP
jgi:2,4-dienoyl-CoA reductase-like NADH-dependent reductase (Old Yellow Enzyme family)